MPRLIVLCCLFMAVPANAAPKYETPPFLVPFQDFSKIENILVEASDLFSKAELKVDDKVLSKKGCQDAEVAAVYRGMALAMIGYRTVLHRIEKGWFGENRESPAKSHKFSQRRNLVLKNIVAPIQLTISLDKILNEGKWHSKNGADIKSFLRFLVKTKRIREILHSRAKKRFAKIEKRKTEEYGFFAKESLYVFKKDVPDRLIFDDLSEAYMKLYNKVRGRSDSLSSCYTSQSHRTEGEYIVYVRGVEIKDLPNIRTSGHFFPLSYGIGFWQRRYEEGTHTVAEFLLRRAISWLSKGN